MALLLLFCALHIDRCLMSYGVRGDSVSHATVAILSCFVGCILIGGCLTGARESTDDELNHGHNEEDDHRDHEANDERATLRTGGTSGIIHKYNQRELANTRNNVQHTPTKTHCKQRT
jgi:hypothetical protein